MKTYFRDRLRKCDNLIGTFDGISNEYNFTVDYGLKQTEPDGTKLDPITVSFNEESKGWVSFKSFIPSSGVFIGGKYITSNTYKIWEHHSNVNRYNNFYEQQYESELDVVFNDMPSSVKSFKAINYEGSQSKVLRSYDLSTATTITDAAGDNVSTSDGQYYNLEDKAGWYVSSFNTDLQEGKAPEFINKENKWFNKITGVATTLDNLDISEFSVQGLGFPIAVTSDDPTETTLTIQPN
jgi:hypothetical protein